jgi:hypothetical protein
MLDHEFRCITPELPFGAHPTPMRPDADLTTAGLGRLGLGPADPPPAAL